jgi:hypothetical protein
MFLLGLYIQQDSFQLKPCMINNGVRLSQEIWRAKMPMKIKIFMWYLKRGVILTKDNLARPNWNEEKTVHSVI